MTLRQLASCAAGQGARLLLLLALAAPVPAWADATEGLADFRAGRFSEAVAAWRTAALNGDAAAALYLGVLNDTGIGVPQNPAEALDWYTRGAAGGNPSAMLNTAVMYDAGRGTAADPAKAAEWYRRAAEAGSGRAAYNLGLLYQEGTGVPLDREKARAYFRMAVARGVAAGREHLAQLGERQAGPTGRAVPDPAMVAFQQAQRVLLTRGPQADVEAATLFHKAAEAGNALAAYNLGYCYEHGIGVPLSIDQALTWYRRSASSTNDPALRAIASSGLQNLMLGVDHVQR